MLRRRAQSIALMLTLATAAPALLAAPAGAQSAAGHPGWPGKGQLFVAPVISPSTAARRRSPAISR